MVIQLNYHYHCLAYRLAAIYGKDGCWLIIILILMDDGKGRNYKHDRSIK